MQPFSRQYLHMAGTFAYYGFKMRDQSTILGFFWTLLHPLLLFLILFTLFRQRLGTDTPNFGMYLLIGIVHWSLFATATGKAVNCLMARREMVVNMNFPKELIVLGEVGGVAASSLLEFLVVCGFAIAVGVAFKAAWLLLPLVFLAQLIFVLAVSLVLGSIQVFVRDTERIWSLILRMGFFAVPIFYPLSMLGDGVARQIVQANPLTQYMEYSRSLIIDGQIPPSGDVLNSVAISGISLALSFAWFRRIEDSFAERL
jgi:ABC-type polysaccharide/polyol phosphate export permease